MSNQAEPVVLDLAPLPRDKIGPFLILGLEKDASKEQIEASWARRLIWSRKNQVRVSLEDINWAKETIVDADKRLMPRRQVKIGGVRLFAIGKVSFECGGGHGEVPVVNSNKEHWGL